MRANPQSCGLKVSWCLAQRQVHCMMPSGSAALEQRALQAGAAPSRAALPCLPRLARLTEAATPLPCPPRYLGTLPCLRPGLQLMDSPASASRVAAFHDWLSVGAMGILPGFPGAGRVQCVAALDFVQLLLGWLLPTFLVARARWQAVQARASTQTNARREPDLDARLACWLMDSVFLADAPDGLPVLAWFILLTLAWLAAGLVGVALVG